MFKYAKLSDMLKQIIQHKKQLKQVLYNKSNNTKSINISSTYSLLSLVTNNYNKFQQFIQKVQIKTNSTIQNKFLFIVMTAEFINVGKIQGGGKVKRIIMENLELMPEIKRQSKINKQTVQIRLIQDKYIKNNNNNNNNINIPNQHRQYQKWKQIFQDVKHFQPNRIIPNIYNLSSLQYQQLIHQYPSILSSSSIVIQSFSSALPPFLLLSGISQSSLKSFTVLDTCSAPGNKTIQLGQYIYYNNNQNNQNFNQNDQNINYYGQKNNNNNKINVKRNVLAFEKDKKRFEVLKNTINKYNKGKYNNIKIYNQNFLETNPNQNRFKKVKFIMLDPSCSGSGMLSNYQRDISSNTNNNNINNISSNNNNTIQQQQQQQSTTTNFQYFCLSKFSSLPAAQKQRINQLHTFQISLLNHSASFHPLRISYSTCSIYHKQNQQVVQKFLSQNKQYQLKGNKIIKENIGKYSICQGFGETMKTCVRIDPRGKQSDGFFVAVFKRKKQYRIKKNIKK